jgi:hypothetical protein
MSSSTLTTQNPLELSSALGERARPKVCLVCQKYQLLRQHIAYHSAMEARFALTRYFVDDGWPESVDQIPGYRSYDAIIWYVRFRELIARPPFDWKRYDGLRIMYDLDAYQNFSRVAGDRYIGAWPRVFCSNRFDVLICTGKATRDNLRDAGVNAVWVPKGYDRLRFRDLGRQRDGLCYFGDVYPARAAMLKHLKRHQVPITRFQCSFFELNERLNGFLACVICNMAAVRVAPALSLRSLLRPGAAISLRGGPELMIKNFEVPASGCVAFCDWMEEMSDLGFVDGTTIVCYRDFDELVEKLDRYMNDIHALRRIAADAADLCVRQHTWDQRAEQFARVIAGDVAA